MTKAKSIARGKDSPSTPAVSEQMLRQMIAEAAYYRALARGFNGGNAVDDWLAAEKEISEQFSGMQ